MQLFYSQDLSPTDAQFSFSKEESRHITKKGQDLPQASEKQL